MEILFHKKETMDGVPLATACDVVCMYVKTTSPLFPPTWELYC